MTTTEIEKTLLTMDQLQALTDANSWKNGQKYFAKGEVQSRSRTSSTLYAKVTGSKDYQVSIQLKEQKIQPHCTCPAYRRNKYCKHVIASAIAWIQEPDTFIFVEESQLEERKKQFKTKRTKKTKADKEKLMTAGLEMVEKLIQDITGQGFSMMSEQTVATFKELSEFVKSHKLRRLGNSLTELKEELQAKEMNINRILQLLGDCWFTTSAIRAYEQGKLNHPTLLEELVGKTWRKTELEKVENLHLIEVGFSNELLPSGFRVETSIFLDLKSGQMYTEKQITPQRVKYEPKPSYQHVLEVKEAYLYPGQSPKRIKLESFTERAVERVDVEVCFQFAHHLVDEIIGKVRANKSSLFPHPDLYVCFQPKEIVKYKKKWFVVDHQGNGIPINANQGLSYILAGLENILLFAKIEEKPELRLHLQSILTLDIPTDLSYLSSLPVIRL